VGGVTEPVRIGRDFYVAKLVERADSTLPPYEDLEVELQNRVYVEKMEKTKRHWLDSLRKRTHVEIRL
jgi:peptidyl-prolyl cis-trans isomerase SurA